MSVDFSGIWDAELSTSTFVAPKPAALQVKIEHRDAELREELIATKADGSQERGLFLYRTTGEPHQNRFHGRPIHNVAKWVGEELVIETRIELDSRETYFCDCWSLSADKEILVMEHRNDALAGQRVVFARTD